MLVVVVLEQVDSKAKPKGCGLYTDTLVKNNVRGNNQTRIFCCVDFACAGTFKQFINIYVDLQYYVSEGSHHPGEVV